MKFTRDVNDKLSSGILSLPDRSTYWVTTQAHEKGLLISKRFRPIFWRQIWVSWDAVQSIVVYKSVLSAHLANFTDARLFVDDSRIGNLTVPWREDFLEIVPDSIDVSKSNLTLRQGQSLSAR